jgi:hypothetical protein
MADDREEGHIRKDEGANAQNESPGLLAGLLSALSESGPLSMDGDMPVQASPMESPYRSEESRDFLTRFVLGPDSAPSPSSFGDHQTTVDSTGHSEEDEDDEEQDINAYTLKIRGEVIDFFVAAAERVNALIDAKSVLKIESEEQERLEDAKVEEQVQENKKQYQQIYRPKIVEYLTLIHESIRELQLEEEQLLKFCSTMYPSTCE